MKTTALLIRRGHAVYLRASELSQPLPEGAQPAGKIAGNGRWYYQATLLPGFKWDSAKSHYPLPVRK